MAKHYVKPLEVNKIKVAKLAASKNTIYLYQFIEKNEATKQPIIVVCILKSPYHNVKDLSMPKLFFIWQIS